MKPGWISVIGLEIHVQLASKRKIYCPEAFSFGAMPNTQTSPVSLGHPGVLPRLNAACVDMAVKTGLATKCSIAPLSWFARKNYFYPDLPKGYQISQDKTPICTKGRLDIRLKDGSTKTVGITRIHIEEDAGKSIHDQDPYDTLIDLNRAGTGLIEIVSEPDMRTAEEAMAYITEVRKLVRYLRISDGNMEEGNLRVDANISVMRETDGKFGTRCEVKNLNSISNVARAINYEIDRQIAVIEGGGAISQQTLTWDAVNGITFSMRDKEESADYRYFPEPDLQPIQITAEKLATLHHELPALPDELYARYTSQLGLPDHDATLLTEAREFAEYFEALLAAVPNARSASNWMNGPVKTYMNENAVDIHDYPLTADKLAGVINLVETGKVSLSIAKDKLMPLLLQDPAASAENLAADNNLLLQNDTAAIDKAIAEVLDGNADKVQTYLDGKTGLLGFFVGNVMKATGGKADPKLINQMMTDALEKRRE